MNNFLYSTSLLILMYCALYFPGRLICELTIGSIKNLTHTSSLIVGFAFFTIISIFFYYFELKLSYLNSFILAFSFFSFIYLIKENVLDLKFENIFSLLKDKKIIISSFFIVFVIQSNQLMVSGDNLGSDYWYYAAQSNYFVEKGFLSMKFPYFDATNSTYPFSFFFTIVALLQINTNFSSVEIINHLGSVIYISVIYLNYKLLDHFIGHKIISIFSILLFLIVTNSLDDGTFAIFTSYPSYPKLASVFLFFPVYLYLEINRTIIGKKYLFILGALIIAFVNLHPQNHLWVMIYLVAFLIIEIIKVKRIRIETFYPLLMGLVLISINAFLISEFMYSEASAISQYSIENANGVIVDFKGMNFVNPVIYFKDSYFHYFGINALAILLVLGFSLINRDILVVYSLSLLVVIVFIIFNPFFVEILIKVAPYFIFERFIYLIPTISIISYPIALYLKFLSDNFTSFNSVKFSFGFLLVTAFILKSHIDTNDINKSSASFFNFFSNNVQVDSLVLADGITAYKLPAFKAIKVLLINEGFLADHINQIDKNNINFVYDDRTKLDEKISIINSYKFQYIVINKKLNNKNLIESEIPGYIEIFNNNLYRVLYRNQ